MREIKFRAWDTLNLRMVEEPYRFEPMLEYYRRPESGYGKEWDTPFRYYEQWQDVEDGIDRPCYVMQFTGLKDKNGKDLYEGDIIQTYRSGKKSGKLYIKYLENSFVMVQDESDERMDCIWFYEFEVTGNIYENHELI